MKLYSQLKSVVAGEPRRNPVCISMGHSSMARVTDTFDCSLWSGSLYPIRCDTSSSE